MITRFRGMNLSSKDPKRLALFYRDILGVTVIDDAPNFDGISFGNRQNEPVFWIWNENEWGRSSEGPTVLVFDCDDHDKTYRELIEKGVELAPPGTAVWGGKELYMKDPDGNIILIL